MEQTSHKPKDKPDYRSGHAAVNGLEMYYEIHGTGEPLVLLHGGVGASAMFARVLPAFAGHRQVITVDLQAHGRTADIDRPLRAEYLADDVAALMGHLGIVKADLLGYSFGGAVALCLATRHPGIVRRLVLVSAPFARNGWYPDVLEAMNRMSPAAGEGMKRSPLAKLYPDVDWPALLGKLHDYLIQDYDWSTGVAALKMPAMIAFADADAIRPSHIVDFYTLLGGGQKDAGMDGAGRAVSRLAVVPGTTHYNILSSPLLPAMVNSFLDPNN